MSQFVEHEGEQDIDASIYTQKTLSLHDALCGLLNRYSVENNSDTPDFALATFLLKCLSAYENAVQERSAWWGEREYASTHEAHQERKR